MAVRVYTGRELAAVWGLDERYEPEHLRSHHVLPALAPVPECVLHLGCTYTYERRPPTRDDWFAHDRTKDAD